MKALVIYLVAGEPSGDALGAGLMRALKAANPEIQFAGIGGEQMQQEGLQSLFPYRELSIMGFLEILPHIPKLLYRIRQTVKDIASKQPAAIITIDSPGFTFRLAKALRDNANTTHIRRVHYVAPSVWAYKPERAHKTAQLFQLLLTLLPFEPPYFEREGLKTIFVGHPVLWQDWNGNSAAFRAKHGIAPDAPILLILPGSRPREVEKHLPIFIKSALALTGFVPVVLAGSLVKESIRELVPVGVHVVDMAEKKNAFAAASLALSKSGTITLELAAAGVPMVVAHKMNALSAWAIRRMIRIPYVSLVNIAAKKELVPELLQEKCTPEIIVDALITLSAPEAQSVQRKACSEAIRQLRSTNTQTPDALAAQAVIQLISTPAVPQGEAHETLATPE